MLSIHTWIHVFAGDHSSHCPGRILYSGKKYEFFNGLGHSMPLTGFVTLGKLLNLSEVSFYTCKIGMITEHTSLGLHDDYILGWMETI